MSAGCQPEVKALFEEGEDMTRSVVISPVIMLPPELSGCAVVDGGVLIVEDEAIGSVMLAREIDSRPVALEVVKLERKKRDRAPYAPKSKLFPVQDFEDIASNGADVVFFIGSHNGKGGERRPDREFLLRAVWEQKSSELKVSGENYNLLEQINPALRALGCDIGLSTVDVDEVLNIEGLALHDGRLYIGFRAPLTPEKKAIVLHAPVGELLDAQGRPEPVAVVLELDGGGIRALDWDPKREQLLIVSGPSRDGDTAPAALWQCDQSGDNLQKILVFDEAIARKHPEGVCRLPDGRLLIVLDGEERASGSEVVILKD